MAHVRFERCQSSHPLIQIARLPLGSESHIAGWTWETYNGDLPIDDVAGRPTDEECIACAKALLRLGRVSFLADSPKHLVGKYIERVGEFDRFPAVLGLPVFSRFRLPPLISTRLPDAAPDMFFSYGNWSLGSQMLLLMPRSSVPSQEERLFLLGAMRANAPLPDLPELLALLAPMTDGCGIIAVSKSIDVIEQIDRAFGQETL